jgi:hypothetical protein
MGYERRYYLHRRVRKAGFSLRSGRGDKTINVLPGQATAAQNNRHLTELREKYSYAVQYINPIMTL